MSILFPTLLWRNMNIHLVFWGFILRPNSVLHNLQNNVRRYKECQMHIRGKLPNYIFCDMIVTYPFEQLQIA
jgi:hypothetical protein